MTLDEAQSKRVCRKCQKPGHIAKNCRGRQVMVRQTETTEVNKEAGPSKNMHQEAAAYLAALDEHHRQVLVEQLLETGKQNFQEGSE